MTQTQDASQDAPIQRGRRAALVAWWGPHPYLQVIFIAALALALGWMTANVAATLERVGIRPGFGFLTSGTSFQIGESLIPFSAGDSYLRAILVGLLNTLRVAIASAVLATVLGVALAIFSLSGNRPVMALVRFYIEVVRNTPLLLQLFFWIALAQALPHPRNALGGAGILLSNRGLFLPWPELQGGSALTLPVVAALVVLWVVAARWLWRKRAGRGIALSLLVLIASIWSALALTGTTAGISVPKLNGFNIHGGISLSPEFAALLLALTVKFSAFVAEIVRAGILSVPKGQREAARALGLRQGQILRHVVLPQALQVIVPLITSSFLDLAKDASLAVAIGYPDLVSILNTTANTTGHAIEALLIMVGIYLVVNLLVAVAMNSYNSRVALRGLGGRG